jgi:hypothetical protein
MAYADSAERAALIGGYRELADFLESNPEVLAPTYPVVFTFPPDGDWAAKCAAIDVIAARLGVVAYSTGTGTGHYVAARFFGPVEYRAVAIPRHDNEGE